MERRKDHRYCYMILILIITIIWGLIGCKNVQAKKYVKVSAVNSDEWTENWSYDENGKETSHYTYDEEGELIFAEEKNYDENGSKEEFIQYSYEYDSPAIITKQDRYYDDGKIMKIVNYGGDGTDPECYPTTTTYEYKDTVVLWKTVDKNDELITEGDADYCNGQLYEKNDGYDLTYENKFEFDKANNLVKWTQKLEDEIVTMYSYSYDEEGNVIKETEKGSYYDDGKKVNYILTTKYKYQLLSEYLKENAE